MRTLYICRQGCFLGVQQETVIIKHKGQILDQAQLPLLEQIFVFGYSQLSTQLIRACLRQNIVIAYLSRSGFCHGRINPIPLGFRYLNRQQATFPESSQFLVAQTLISAKVNNSRVVLQRQARRRTHLNLQPAIDALAYLLSSIESTSDLQRLLGLEGAAAATYYPAWGCCIQNPTFIFAGRTRQPPGNPVNALLSFGYQVLWNHVLSLIELNGLDPYLACLHRSSDRHPALASDLIEEFRSPLVDALVLGLVNQKMLDVDRDFEFRNGGCFLTELGRKTYLKAWVKRMEKTLQTSSQPVQTWFLLNQQVKAYRAVISHHQTQYTPYQIR